MFFLNYRLRKFKLIKFNKKLLNNTDTRRNYTKTKLYPNFTITFGTVYRSNFLRVEIIIFILTKSQ